MVNSDYHVTMYTTSVGVAELKAKLSEYLREVRNGHEVVVMDRNRPVARIVPYEAQEHSSIVREPIGRYRSLGDVPMPPRPETLTVDPVELLLQDRREDE
jgi:prevent-host-death family protein